MQQVLQYIIQKNNNNNFMALFETLRQPRTVIIDYEDNIQ